MYVGVILIFFIFFFRALINFLQLSFSFSFFPVLKRTLEVRRCDRRLVQVLLAIVLCRAFQTTKERSKVSDVGTASREHYKLGAGSSARARATTQVQIEVWSRGGPDCIHNWPAGFYTHARCKPRTWHSGVSSNEEGAQSRTFCSTFFERKRLFAKGG